MDAKTTFREARHLYRLADADPGYSFDNRMTRSGRNPLAHGHVNPTRDRAVAEAHNLHPLCVTFLGRRKDSRMASLLRASLEHELAIADARQRRAAIYRMGMTLHTSYRGAMKGRLFAFTTGYSLLDAKAKRIAATTASHAAQATMLAEAQKCVTATKAAVAAWQQVAA